MQYTTAQVQPGTLSLCCSSFTSRSLPHLWLPSCSHLSLAVCFQFNQPDYATVFLSQSYQGHQTLNLSSSLLMSCATLAQIVAPLIHPIHLRCPRSELTGCLSSSNPSKSQPFLSLHLITSTTTSIRLRHV